METQVRTDSRSNPCGCAILFALRVHLIYLPITDKSVARYIQSNLSEFGQIHENINHDTTSLLRKLVHRIIPLLIRCYNNGFHAVGTTPYTNGGKYTKRVSKEVLQL